MKILADLHTHSINSRFKHGKNTIEELALEANEIGLVEIAVTDHGYSHFFRTTKQKIKQARKIIDEINTWSKTKVLLGIEADIVSENGDLDIDNETLSMLDILIVGYHKMIFTDFASFFGKTKNTEAAKKKCTNAFVNAINRYPVTIVSHDSILTTDLYEIGKACSERGTMVEINNRHTKWNDKQMQDLLDSGCLFVVSSDAHSRNQVGKVDRAFEYIRKYDIPSERVVNVEFSEDEISEDEKSYLAYRSVYEQIAKQKKEREAYIENKRKTEITGNLSSEMEKALKDIAAEKGLHYEEQKKETIEEQDYVKNIADEDFDLIKQAEEYIKNQEIQNIQQENENLSQEIEENESEILSFDDSHPLVKDAFKDKFQAINNVVKQTESNQVATAAKEENIEELKSNHIQNNSNLSAFEQLSSSSLSQSDMQGLKNIMAGSSPREEVKMNNSSIKIEAQPVADRVEPEDFMGSITQTRLSKNVETVQKPAQETGSQAKKPTVKTGKRGGFIAVNNLIDEE